jgi:thiol-disulfide isomerase/thioredoxin
MALSFTLAAGCKRSAPAPETAQPAASAAPATPAAPPSTAAAAKPSKGPGHPYTPRHLYDEDARPMDVIGAALAQARAEHKRVILDFGGDWCGDCQVLDIYMHDPVNEAILKKNFIVVHISIGHMDKNLAVAGSYGVPISKGVPALAVLAPSGTVLYSQKGGEFEDMRHMDVQSVTDFLNRWKA